MQVDQQLEMVVLVQLLQLQEHQLHMQGVVVVDVIMLLQQEALVVLEVALMEQVALE